MKKECLFGHSFALLEQWEAVIFSLFLYIYKHWRSAFQIPRRLRQRLRPAVCSRGCCPWDRDVVISLERAKQSLIKSIFLHIPTEPCSWLA